MLTASHREELILAHIPQVELLARRLHRRCPQAELDDLISAGTVGLIQAVDRFDPSRNLKLRTLADHRIRGAMLDYLCQIDPLPRSVRRFQKQRNAVMAELADADVIPTCEQLAESLGIPVRKYVRLSLMVTASKTISIETLPFAIQRLAG